MLQSKNRTKSSKSIAGTIVRALLAALALALMFACSSSSDTTTAAPDYVGAWSKLDGFGTGTGTLTVTFTTSTVTYSVSGGTLNGGTASGSLLVDEAAKHLTQSSFTVSGALTTPFTRHHDGQVHLRDQRNHHAASARPDRRGLSGNRNERVERRRPDEAVSRRGQPARKAGIEDVS